MSKKSKKCRMFMDGGLWCCVGPKFVNIQESASGYGDTPEEAHTDYLADVAAMKAAKKLVKAAKKVKKAKDAEKTPPDPFGDFDLPEKKAVSKKVKKEKGTRNERVHKAIVKAFKKGTNRAGVISLALIKNNKFKSPLPDAEVTDMVRVEWERLNPASE